MYKELNDQFDLKKQKQIFETIFYQSTDGILIMENGIFVECNDAVVKMLKYQSKDQFLNTHPSELSPEFQPDGRSSFAKAEENTRFVLENGSRRFEWVHKKADGELFWVGVVLTNISTKDKTIFLVTWRDIDEQKKNALELKELNATLEERIQKEVEENRQKDLQLYEMVKMAQMGEMIENIAHQWRQPLSAISTIASSIHINHMLGHIENEELLIKHMQDIEQYTQFLSKTIDTFRNFIRDDKRSEEVILQKNIEDTLLIIDAILKINNITLINEIDPDDSLKVTMLSGNLSQVIINIINNAKDVFLERKIKDRWIKLSLNQEDGYAILSIEDNGGGIPEEILPKIFDLYFTTKEKSHGSGLGLHMSQKMVVEGLHGKLYADNTQNGARFSIALPLV